MAPRPADLEIARERLAGIARVTPLYSSETLTRMSGRPVYLKEENLQRTGSFKIRGAVNRLALLTEAERKAGVVAASAGNHGQAVAWAAREAGVTATIFVPEDAPMAKVDATRAYGAHVEMVGSGLEEALASARKAVEEAGATLVHPYDDEQVIAGQGTIGLELADQLPEAETVLVPVGGGGLASGIALALREKLPDAGVVGVQAEPSGFGVADGIAVKGIGAVTRPILDETLADLVSVSGEEIAEAVVLLLERTKLLVEGAGAVGVAALLAGKVDSAGPTVVVLSGGNIDATTLISVMRHGLTLGGRYLVLRTRISDRPGELMKLLELVARERINVVDVEHHREGMDLRVGETEVELTLVTRDEAHCEALLAEVRSWGYPVERLR
jgi:threonine dehydratase